MGKGKQEMFDKRQNEYQRFWMVPLMKTCLKNPLFCCWSMACPSCTSYQLRHQALYGDMTRYVCCNGNWPCSGRMGEKSCPEFCLCMEVFCCFAQSVVSTRWMIQDELQIQTTACDNFIIGVMICMQYLACVCNILACLTGDDTLESLADVVDCAADILWCTVCGCMQTQHRVELNERDKGGSGAAPVQGVPPQQQMMPDAYPSYPPPGGNYPPGSYPPPPGAYPPPGSYPPPPGAYPPPGSYPPPPGAYPPANPGYGYPPAPAYPPMQR